jgi:hypothetical protein
VPAPLPSHRLVAHNAATASENKIHDDAVARRHGFAGGLVPGITVFGYLTHPVVERWGRDWLERGTMDARFRRPIYDGEDVEVDGTLGDDGHAEVEARNPDGEVCAVATATLPLEPAAAPSLDDYPVVQLPAERRPPSPEALAAVGNLGTVEAGFHAGRVDETLALVGDDLPIYGELGVAHPTWLLYLANAILASNVALGPWIHTASDVTNLGLLGDGQRLSARGRVARLFEKGGHQLVELDILMVADGTRPVAAVRHTAIYRLKPAAD